MNLRQLAYWLAVVDEGSFTRAAQRMHVAQPSLSQQIRALESELGGPLIERLPRAIRLTQAGKAFLPEARAAVNAAERAARAARAALKLESGDLEIATVRSVAVGILPPAIRIWHDRYPSVSIRLREHVHRDSLLESMRAGYGDIAIGPRPRDWGGQIAPLGFEEFVIVVAADDPLAERDTPVALKELADRAWVLFAAHHGLSELVATVFAHAGYQPRESIVTEQPVAAARFAEAGLGPALVPENIIPEGLDIRVLRAHPPIVRELVAYTRSDWSPAAHAYLGIVQELPWTHAPPGAFVVP